MPSTGEFTSFFVSAVFLADTAPEHFSKFIERGQVSQFNIDGSVEYSCSLARRLPAAVYRHQSCVRPRARAPVVRLERDVLDEATRIGKLEACRNGLAASLQEPQPLAELSTDHPAIPPGLDSGAALSLYPCGSGAGPRIDIMQLLGCSRARRCTSLKPVSCTGTAATLYIRFRGVEAFRRQSIWHLAPEPWMADFPLNARVKGSTAPPGGQYHG